MDRPLLIHVAVLLGLTALAVSTAQSAEPPQPDPARQQALVHLVRQDCGSCHGMRLAGGLGPALTPARLADWPDDSLVATIIHGRRPDRGRPPALFAGGLLDQLRAHGRSSRLQG